MPEQFRPIEITSIRETEPWTGGKKPKYQFMFTGKYTDTGQPTDPAYNQEGESMFKTLSTKVKGTLAAGMVVLAQRQERSEVVSYWIDKAERIQGVANPAPQQGQQEAQPTATAPAAPVTEPAPQRPVAPPAASFVHVDTAPITMCLSYAKDVFIAMVEDARERSEEAPPDDAITAYADTFLDWYKSKLAQETSRAEARASKVQHKLALQNKVKAVLEGAKLVDNVLQAELDDETLIDWFLQEGENERKFRRKVEDALEAAGVLE